jgi:hypothetical protein
MSKWRPIYTAPKDGTAVLVHVPNKGWIEATYDTKYKWWNFIKLNSHGCGCCSWTDEDPDAWAPLPFLPPPKTGEMS